MVRFHLHNFSQLFALFQNFLTFFHIIPRGYNAVQCGKMGKHVVKTKKERILGELPFQSYSGFPPRCTGVYFGTPQYFSRKNLDFYRDSGCTKVRPEKNGVLEVPTVQSVWLAVSKEVEEKGGKI